jgi:hypothetical protein
MLAIALLSVMFVAPAEVSPQEQARIYAAAGEAHLERAAVPGEQQLDEFDGAHKNFDLAYLTANDPGHLCRALQVAELVLATVTFTDPQPRLSWEELQREDLERLRKDAAQTGRANCRHDARVEPQRPRVAVLTDADFSTPVAPRASSPADSERLSIDPLAPTPTQRRRWKAQTAAGAILTGAGVGLVGMLAGAIGLRVRYAEELRGIANNADITGALAASDRGRAAQINADSLQTRNVAIGVGVAGAVSLATGIALLSTRKKAPHAVALMPYAGPLGGGAVLRLRF